MWYHTCQSKDSLSLLSDEGLLITIEWVNCPREKKSVGAWFCSKNADTSKWNWLVLITLLFDVEYCIKTNIIYMISYCTYRFSVLHNIYITLISVQHFWDIIMHIVHAQEYCIYVFLEIYLYIFSRFLCNLLTCLSILEKKSYVFLLIFILYRSPLRKHWAKHVGMHGLNKIYSHRPTVCLFFSFLGFTGVALLLKD